MRIAVFARNELDDGLTAAEMRELVLLGYTGPRAAEWVAGRAAAHRVLGLVDVLADADGAPRVAAGVLSLSHDDNWVAVATAPSGGIAVDLCSRTHAPRIATILQRLGIHGDPCLTWAALECALKLRRQGVWTLVGARLAVEAAGPGAVVRGIGEDVEVRWRNCGDYTLAWSHEQGEVVSVSGMLARPRRPAVRARVAVPAVAAENLIRVRRVPGELPFLVPGLAVRAADETEAGLRRN